MLFGNKVKNGILLWNLLVGFVISEVGLLRVRGGSLPAGALSRPCGTFARSTASRKRPYVPERAHTVREPPSYCLAAYILFGYPHSLKRINSLAVFYGLKVKMTFLCGLAGY